MNYQEQDTFGIYRNHTGPGPRLMGANTLDGNDVYNKQDDVLGDIKEIMLDVSKERLKEAPGFDKDAWPDMADPTWVKGVHAYYGVTPYSDGMM